MKSLAGKREVADNQLPLVGEQISVATVDAGMLTRFILSWIVTEFRGCGLWRANVRTVGWNGEYGLFDRDNELTPCAIAAGKVGEVCQKTVTSSGAVTSSRSSA